MDKSNENGESQNDSKLTTSLFLLYLPKLLMFMINLTSHQSSLLGENVAEKTTR